MFDAAWFPKRSSRPFFLIAVAAVAQATCSVLVDQNRVQCLTDEDCTARGGDFSDSVCQDTVCRPNPTWSCLGSVTWPTVNDGRRYTAVLHIRDLITDQPTLGVTARVCRKLDIGCSDPILSGVVGDTDGNVSIPVEVNFDGYVELQAKDKMPGLFFFYPPIDGDRDVPLVPLFQQVQLAKLAELSGKTLTPDRGHVLLGAYDCEHLPAEGVHITTPDGDALTSSFYLLQKIPTASASSTDSSGRGGFINLRPGQVSVLGDLDADGRRVGAVSVIVRPGAVTYTSLVPSPSKHP